MSEPRLSRIKIIAAVTLATVIIGAMMWLGPKSEQYYQEKVRHYNRALIKVLADYSVFGSDMTGREIAKKIERGKKTYEVKLEYHLSKKVDFEGLSRQIVACGRRDGFSVYEVSHQSFGAGRFLYEIVLRHKSLFYRLRFRLAWIPRDFYHAAKKPVAKITPRVAIVIDDWGYHLDNTHALYALKKPVTIAVLPRLAHSREIAREAKKRGIEVLLHLPMEPIYTRMPLEKDTIKSGMSRDEVKAIVGQDLDDLVTARGISNHMGSKATQDPEVMTAVFEVCKKRHLYFLDSYVTGKSICRQLAAEQRIRFASRDTFLDNEPAPEYIRSQFQQLIASAKRKGYAVGIAHDRRMSLDALQSLIPEAEKEGVVFVRLSEIAQ